MTEDEQNDTQMDGDGSDNDELMDVALEAAEMLFQLQQAQEERGVVISPEERQQALLFLQQAHQMLVKWQDLGDTSLAKRITGLGKFLQLPFEQLSPEHVVSGVDSACEILRLMCAAEQQTDASKLIARDAIRQVMEANKLVRHARGE